MREREREREQASEGGREVHVEVGGKKKGALSMHKPYNTMVI